MRNKKQKRNPGRIIGPALLQQMYDAGKGRSKYLDKRANGNKVPMDKIYCYTTLVLYIRIWTYFWAYLRANAYKHRSIGALTTYLQWYADYLWDMGYSAWTIKTRVSAVKKGLGIDTVIWTAPRHRKDIHRSRGHANDQYLRRKAKKHRCIVLFCICVGLRKRKELKHVHGSDLIVRNGKAYIHVRKGKGGQARYVEIIGSQTEINIIIAMCKNAVKAARKKAEATGILGENDDLLFPFVPGDLDVHALRAIYACRAYLHVARSIDIIPDEDQYHFRFDMGGLVTDVKAMMYATEQLGHHRIGVIAGNYMWPLDYVMHADFSWLTDLVAEAIKFKN